MNGGAKKAKYKVFFVGMSSHFWVDVANKLNEQHDILPLYWVGLPKLESYVKELFPNIIYHNVVDAIFGKAPQGFNLVPNMSIDANMLDSLARHQCIALHMMDRMDIGASFLFRERVSHYHLLLTYWLNTLKSLKPDLVIFPTVPHVIYDYVIYALCDILGIPTLMFIKTSIPGLIYPLSKFEEGSTKVNQLLKNRTRNTGLPYLSEAAKNHLNELRSSYDIAKPYHTRYHQDKLFHVTANQTIKSSISRVLKPSLWPNYISSILDKTIRPAPMNYLKMPNQEVGEKSISGMKWHHIRSKVSKRRQALHKQYEQLTKPFKQSDKYILFAMHMQPEATTSPQGGWYVDQYLAIEMLARNLPSNWKLYVKEAHGQFMPFFSSAGSTLRDLSFYKRILSIPGVQLISTKEESFRLIDNSQAVSTITGTIGWEALVRGVPSLAFGYPWYHGCPGLWEIRSENTLRSALNQIQQGHNFNKNMIEWYLGLIEKVGFYGYFSTNKSNPAKVKEQVNNGRLAAAIFARLQNIYKND